MTPRAIDTITRWVVLGPFVLWAVWELALVWLRARGWPVRLISQEARSIAFRGLPTLAYFLSGLTAHFFLTWRRPTWNEPLSTGFGVAFWAIGVAYLAADVFDPARAYWPLVTQWLRWPPVVALVGLASGCLLFPQRALWVPGSP
jgi:hypothetical protein